MADVQNVNIDPAPAADPTTSALEQAKADIAKIEEAFKNLEALPGEICATELVILRQKRDMLIAEVKAEAEKIAAETGQIEQSLIRASCFQK